MQSSLVLSTAYTDSPPLHPNVLLGSAQLLAWLVFHPSAWRSHIARLDVSLCPDFCLAELRSHQWRARPFQRLFFQGFIICPLLSSLFFSLIAWVSGASFAQVLSASVNWGVSLVLTGLALAWLCPVAAGTAFILGSVVTAGARGMLWGASQLLAPVNPLVFYDFETASLKTPGVFELGSLALLFGLTAALTLSVGVQRRTVSVAPLLSSMTVASLIGPIVGGIGIGTGVASAHAISIVASLLRGELSGERLNGVVLLIGGAAVFSFLDVAAMKWRTEGWLDSVRSGISFGFILWLLAAAFYSSIAIAPPFLFFVPIFVLPYVIARSVADAQAAAFAGALGASSTLLLISTTLALPTFFEKTSALSLSLLTLSMTLAGLTFHLWRPLVFYPFAVAWNLLLLNADKRTTRTAAPFLRWHSAFWDEYQRLPLIGLDEHLALLAEYNAAEYRAATEYLSTSKQRWAAQAAEIERDIRHLEACTDVEAIRNANISTGEFAGPVSAYLRSFHRICQDVANALDQETAFAKRQFFAVIDEHLDSLDRELVKGSDHYARRFQHTAKRWRQIVEHYRQELAAAAENHQEIDNPYIVGQALTPYQEIFTGRQDISAQIEQLLVDPRCPPVFLYGQRRMGKTSLLNNIGRLLPSRVVPFFVDLQGAASAGHHAGFLFTLARQMRASAQKQRSLTFPALQREELDADPFIVFDEWLDKIEEILAQQPQEEFTALLMLDEIERLLRPFAEGRLSEDSVFGMLRHLVQHRPRFKVLLTAAHTPEELQQWATYLINFQIIHLEYFSFKEAQQLIEHPVKNFALGYTSEATQRVFELTRGHPYFVQMLCRQLVDLKNTHEDSASRRLATLCDVETAATEAIKSQLCSFYFLQMEDEPTYVTSVPLLRFLATHQEEGLITREVLERQFPTNIDPSLTFLMRWELIEQREGGYQFQVEMMRQWFAQQHAT